MSKTNVLDITARLVTRKALSEIREALARTAALIKKVKSA